MSHCEPGVRLILFFCAVLFLSELSGVQGQDLEPRAYSNIPVRMNFLLAGYAYSSGGVLFDPAVPLENAHIKIHGSLLAYARTFGIAGMSGKIDMIMPYVWLSGSAESNGTSVYRDVSGLGDPRFRISVNFIGAPPLSMEEFKDYRQNLAVGASIQVFVPLGQYDASRLVNIGTNRFSFKPELGISKKFGPLFLELAAGVTFYTINYDFFNGKTRSQAPIGSIQGHVSYGFKRGIWAALDGTYYWGGRTTLEGVEGNDLQKNSRLGFTFAVPLNMHNTLKFHVSTGVSTRTGSDFDAVGLVWQYRWGK
jgi:hypothetical protein